MASKEKVLEELNFLGDRISTQVRTLSLAVLALVWLFLMGGKDAPSLPQPFDRGILFTSGLFAIAALLADYLQYVFGYKSTLNTFQEGEKSKDPEMHYDYDSPWWKLRRLCFILKQGLMLVSLAIFGLALGRILL